jgi:hypothetical protein
MTRYLTLDVLNARYWDERISLSAESYENADFFYRGCLFLMTGEFRLINYK